LSVCPSLSPGTILAFARAIFPVIIKCCNKYASKVLYMHGKNVSKFEYYCITITW
jgi:hypothetical protein